MYENEQTGTERGLFLRRLGFACLFIILLLITLKGSFALTITEVTAPATIYEGELLQLSFSTDEPASYAIERDGTSLTTTDTYAEALTYDSAGLYEYDFIATNANGTDNETRMVEVLNKPLAFTLWQPLQSDYTTSSIPFTLETSIPADICYTVSAGGSNTLTKVNDTFFNDTLELEDGLHLITVKCTRNGELASENVTLKVDTEPPAMSLAPTGSVTDETILSVTTNEASDCRYGTVEVAYAQLTSSFSETSALDHEAELDIGEGTHTYYVACQDVYGNTASTESTTFTLTKRPSTKITVEGDNPRKAGTYKLTLEVSEPLREVPTLELTYQGGSTQTLALTEKDRLTYEGLVIVELGQGEKVGSFTFSGTDLDGTAGTRITEGDLFIIDTIPPEKVETFKAFNGSDGVNLTWYYPDEDAITYNLYRSLKPGVAYTDLYTTVIGDRYLDRQTEREVRYYYRIAAVDEAGNVGSLSDEEWASSAVVRFREGGGEAILSPQLQVALELKQKEVDRYILDGERSLKDLREEQEKERSWLISKLSLVDEATDALQELRKSRDKLESLRTLALEPGEFNEEITKMQKEIDAARGKLPMELELLNQAAYEESVDQETLDAAVTRALASESFSESERTSYLERARELQQLLRISTTTATARITYANEQKKSLTIIEKHLLANQPQSNILAIETIPKSVTQRADDLVFLDEHPLVLEQDPVLQYNFATLNDESFAYVVPGLVDVPAIRQTRLVPLPKPLTTSTSSPENEQQITGRVTALLGKGLSSQGIFILLGVIIVVGLLVYYFRLQGEPVEVISEQSMPLGTASTVMLPAFAPQSETRTMLIERREEPLAGLLLKAHTLIDETRYPDALHFYKQALARYEEEPFPSEQLREAVREELQLLHNKLLLFDTMSKAYDAIYASDETLLTSMMLQMRQAAAASGDPETKLLEKAKHSYAYFYNQLNRLKQERLRELERDDF